MASIIVTTLTADAEAAFQQVLTTIAQDGNIILTPIEAEIEQGVLAFVQNAATEVGQALSTLWAKIVTLLPNTNLTA